MLKGYDTRTGALRETDIKITVDQSDDDIIICHESKEFGTNGHMHCNTLDSGITTLVEYYLEHLIWKYEGTAAPTLNTTGCAHEYENKKEEDGSPYSHCPKCNHSVGYWMSKS
jgi:hypothetical protein